jgi:hypothetical protein
MLVSLKGKRSRSGLRVSVRDGDSRDKRPTRRFTPSKRLSRSRLKLRRTGIRSRRSFGAPSAVGRQIAEDAEIRHIRNPFCVGDVLSSGVFWTAIGSLAAVVAAIATVLSLRARGRETSGVEYRHSLVATPQPPSEVKFGEDWGEMTPPVRARIGVIDKSDAFEVGLSAMQLDNIGYSGEYNAVVVACVDEKARARVYNAFGMQSLGGSKIRVSSALAESLGCSVGEDIFIESLAVLSD